MLNFNFHNPTRIIFGKDRFAELAKEIPAGAKVLITYGMGSVKRTGTLERVLEALGEFEVLEFGGIEPNPQFTTLMKAAALAKEESVDFLLAVGGGSVMDGTKFIALAAKCSEEEAAKLLSWSFKPSAALPLGCVLTLPATGSEMNAGAVISHGDGKFPVMNPLTFPVFSLLDPTLTYTLPEKQIANGIVDAFIHTVEQYVTFPVDARFQDRTAEGILQSLIEVGPVTLAEPENYDARANFVWLATMALNGLIGAGVPQDWTTHMIGHELTARFGIDHGRTLAIIQPAVWKVRREQKAAKLLQYAERVWGIDEGDEAARIDAAIDKTEAFFESLGVPTRLGAYDIAGDEIPNILAQLEKHGMTQLSEHGDVDLEVSKAILEAAL